jgi:hypothetical protein
VAKPNEITNNPLGNSHGTTLKDKVNEELLAFIKP